MSRGSILVKGFDLQISALPEMVQGEDQPKEEEIKEEKFKSLSANTVEVKDLRPELTSDILKLYFENWKRSGGGSVDEIQIFPAEERALIRFIDTEGTSMNKCYGYGSPRNIFHRANWKINDTSLSLLRASSK